MTLRSVCSVADVPVGTALRVDVDGREIDVVNLGDGEVRALDAVCSHEQYYLDEGEVDVEERTIECPKHGSVFDLDTGIPRALPATRPVAVYEARIDDDDILIEVEP